MISTQEWKVFKELLLQFRVVALTRMVTAEALRMARSGYRLKIKSDRICYWSAHGMEKKAFNQRRFYGFVQLC